MKIGQDMLDISDVSDEDILARALMKPALFRELVGRYEDAFLRKARSIVRNEEDAQDLVQETFTRIYLKGHQFRKIPGASFKSWAYKILVNTAFTQYRKNQKVSSFMTDLDPELHEYIAHTGKEEIDAREHKDYIASILVHLPNVLARALRLHFLEGVPQKEIAQKEGVSLSAIKTRIHRAKKEFQKISNSLHIS